MTPSVPSIPADSSAAPGAPDLRVPFVLGISGLMNLPGDTGPLEAAVDRVIRWLRAPATVRDAQLGAGLGLEHTPLLLLTSLAPGADQLVAEVVLKHEDSRVLGALPFPAAMYREASTFRRGKRTPSGVMPVAEDGLPAGTAEDEARQAAFDAWCGRLGEGALFHVLLKEDVENKGLEETLAADLKDQLRRNLRYRAAGEYVASCADLLIAISDDGLEVKKAEKEVNAGAPVPVDSGTRAIIEVRRSGVTPHLLPVEAAFRWADTGPVVRIFSRRGGGEYAAATPEAGTLELWHALDHRPVEKPGAENADAEWQKAGRAVLDGVARHLETLNTEVPPDCSPEGCALETMMPEIGTLGLSPDYAGQLDRLARLRRRVSSLNSRYDERMKRLRLGLAGAGVMSVLALQLHENGCPHFLKAHGEVHGAWDHGFFFLAAFVAVAVAWWWHKAHRSQGTDERQNDYRAIAEALRVQVYWLAAGTGQSVAAQYLQRQRTELSWLRSAISALAFPYELSRAGFSRLTGEAKLGILRSIRGELTRSEEGEKGTGWVAEQAGYFRKKTGEFQRKKEGLHAVARVLIGSGLVMQVVLIFTHWFELRECLEQNCSLLLLTAAAGVCAVLGLHAAHGAGCRLRVMLVQARGEPVAECQKAAHAGWWHTIFPEWIPHWLACLLCGVVGGFLLSAAGFVLGGTGALPSTIPLLAIVKNVCLATGGALHWYASACFLTENIRRYSAMASLFRTAHADMGRELAALEADGDESAIPRIQALLISLGREALAENAEWLLMHRDRPIEPVAPGG